MGKGRMSLFAGVNGSSSRGRASGISLPSTPFPQSLCPLLPGPRGLQRNMGTRPSGQRSSKVQQVKGPGSDRPEGLPRTCWLPDVSSSFLRCGLRAGDRCIWRVLSWTLSGLCVPFYPHLAWRGFTPVPLLASSALGRSCGGDRGSVQCVHLGRPGGAGLRCTPAPPVSRT